jgi:hypothetical protein
MNLEVYFDAFQLVSRGRHCRIQVWFICCQLPDM